ncbi:MAG: hypothetical protein MJ252_08995 [archaeon]|nr:hypothetical protein [archaeon]
MLGKDICIHSIQTTLDNLHQNFIPTRCETASNTNSTNMIFSNGILKRSSSGARKSSNSKTKKEANRNDSKRKKNFSFFNNFAPTSLHKYSNFNLNMNGSSNNQIQNLYFKKAGNITTKNSVFQINTTKFGCSNLTNKENNNMTNFSMLNPSAQNGCFYTSNIMNPNPNGLININNKINNNTIIANPINENQKKKCIKIFKLDLGQKEEDLQNKMRIEKTDGNILSEKEKHYHKRKALKKKDPNAMEISPNPSSDSNSSNSATSNKNTDPIYEEPIYTYPVGTLEFLINNLIQHQIRNNSQIPYDYIVDIYPNLLEEERNAPIKLNPNYMSSQNEINEQMRAILLDWLIDVHVKFNFGDNTLYTTFYIIDAYLSLKKIQRTNLQLLGVTAMLIACKHEEIFYPKIKEFIYITDNAYQIEDIFKMEEEILGTLNYNLVSPSSLRLYEIISFLLGFNQTAFNFGKFLMEWYMIDFKGIKYSNSVKACATAYITMKFFKMDNYKVCYDQRLFNIMEYQPGIDGVDIIKTCAKDLCLYCDFMNRGNLFATKRKYSSNALGRVAEILYPPNAANSPNTRANTESAE